MPLFHRAHSHRTVAAALAALITVTAVGCDNTGFAEEVQSGSPAAPAPAMPGSSTPTGQPHLTDYGRLLLHADDLSDADDTFAERSSSAANPTGLPGASTLFVNADDTRAISLTVAVYPGAPTATATLKQALSTANTVVTGGTPQPLAVGTDGTMIKGSSPDGAKAVTLVLFTEGPALARLEFDSAPGDTTTDKFVTDIAKMQHVALRVGLPTQR